VFGVLAIGHAAGLLLLIVLALAWGEPLPTAADLGWGLVAGLAGASAWRRSIARWQSGRWHGRAGVGGAYGGASSAVRRAHRRYAGALKLAGFGLALVGIWL